MEYLNSGLYSFLAAKEQQPQPQCQKLGKGAAELQLPPHHESLYDGFNGVPIAGTGEDQAQTEGSKACHIDLDICVRH